MKNALFFLLGFAISLQSVAAEIADQSITKEFLNRLNIYDYDNIDTFGFFDGMALTVLRKNKKRPEFYHVTINVSPEGKRLGFFTSEKCSVKQKEMFYSVVSVNFQNVQFRWFCTRPNNKKSITWYGAVTEEGNEFLIEQFKKKEVVFIKFRSMTIPFETTNFNKAWDDAGGLPL